MAVIKGCKVFKAFVWLQVVLLTVQATELAAADSNLPELNVTSSLEDYIAQVERQYFQIIHGDEAAVAEFRAGYDRELTTIDAQKSHIEGELIIADKKLYSLQFLNELSKHCVQKYRAQFYTITAVRLNFASCINPARSSINTLLSTPDSYIRNLNNLLNSNFKSGIANCKRVHNESYANHTKCVLDLNTGISNTFITYQRAFISGLDNSRCSADTRIRQVVECVFRTVNASLSSIGSTSTLIDGCISGLESCKPCEDQGNGNNNNDTAIIVPEPQPQCPNVVNVITGAELYRNATIRNPFVGLNSTLDCILVNFLRPN